MVVPFCPRSGGIRAEVTVVFCCTSYAPVTIVMATMISIVLAIVVTIVHCRACGAIAIASSVVCSVVVYVAAMMMTIVATIPTV